MGSMSIWHWLFVILFIAVLSIPISKILNRLGFSRWWTIVYFIPFVPSHVKTHVDDGPTSNNGVITYERQVSGHD
jgi:hypothetical protein